MLDKNQRVDAISYYILNDDCGNFYVANKYFTKAKTLDQFVQGLDGQRLYEGEYGYHLGSKKGLKLQPAIPVGCETISDLYKWQERFRQSRQQQKGEKELLNF